MATIDCVSELGKQVRTLEAAACEQGVTEQQINALKHYINQQIQNLEFLAEREASDRGESFDADAAFNEMDPDMLWGELFTGEDEINTATWTALGVTDPTHISVLAAFVSPFA